MISIDKKLANNPFIINHYENFSTTEVDFEHFQCSKHCCPALEEFHAFGEKYKTTMKCNRSTSRVTTTELQCFHELVAKINEVERGLPSIFYWAFVNIKTHNTLKQLMITLSSLFKNKELDFEVMRGKSISFIIVVLHLYLRHIKESKQITEKQESAIYNLIETVNAIAQQVIPQKINSMFAVTKLCGVEMIPHEKAKGYSMAISNHSLISYQLILGLIFDTITNKQGIYRPFDKQTATQLVKFFAHLKQTLIEIACGRAMMSSAINECGGKKVVLTSDIENSSEKFPIHKFEKIDAIELCNRYKGLKVLYICSHPLPLMFAEMATKCTRPIVIFQIGYSYMTTPDEIKGKGIIFSVREIVLPTFEPYISDETIELIYIHMSVKDIRLFEEQIPSAYLGKFNSTCQIFA
ncbi:hypothetical protein L2734_05550 [Parashewanella spongiae]|nr:hypothetical protein [Parashewanella spongiae]MCL1077643.1 hypothetical protein [Parashewanella spongiae]